MTWASLLVLLLALCTQAAASETALTGAEGHPRSRFPLSVYAAPLEDAALDAIVRKAVSGWNAVFQQALGIEAFAWVEREADAGVVVGFEAKISERLMGETRFDTGEAGVIALPVRIVVFEPHAWGQAGRETLVYQVVAHELGHALGLEHAADPRSLMCCIKGTVDFNDPTVRQAYVNARRHPDLQSVTAQLAAHYKRFWRKRN